MLGLVDFDDDIFTKKYIAAKGTIGEASVNSYMLSHGRQYHIVSLLDEEDKIGVKIYKPRFVGKISYKYDFWKYFM